MEDVTFIVVSLRDVIIFSIGMGTYKTGKFFYRRKKAQNA